MEARIDKLRVLNYKGLKEKEVNLTGDVIDVSGRNASGKTTLFDAFKTTVFGTDSEDRTKFSNRPLDKNGEKIHNVDIVTEVTMTYQTFDGVSHTETLTRTEKEDWSKRNGDLEPQLKGNKTFFEHDGYPMSKTEWTKHLSEIFGDDSDRIKLITDPWWLPKQKDAVQRQLVTSAAVEKSDLEILESFGDEFAALKPDFEKASPDDIAAKYKRDLRALKDKQTEIPARIDELQSRKSGIDVEALEKQEQEVVSKREAQVKANQAVFDDRDRNLELCHTLLDQMNSIKDKMTDIVTKANADAVTKRNKLTADLVKVEDDYRKADSEKFVFDRDREAALTTIENLKKQFDVMQEKYNAKKAERWDAQTAICPTCGQALPDEKAKAAHETWKENQKRAMDNINLMAKDIKVQIKAAEKAIAKCGNESQVRHKRLEELDALRNDLKAEISALTEIKGEDIPEWVELLNKGKELRQKYNDCYAATKIDDKIVSLEPFNQQLSEISKSKALVEQDVKIDERVGELTAQQRQTAQEITNIERLQFLLSQYVKRKMNAISESINAQFEHVRWKLFEQQLNGGVREVCEATLDGVPYADLNHAGRLLVGMDIIRTFQKVYGMKFPVWIDNAESVNPENIPEMDCQVILLRVSDGPLTVTTIK